LSAKLVGRRAAVLVILTVFGLIACDSGPQPMQAESEGGGEMSVLMALSKPAAAAIATAEVVVTGDGMADILQVLAVSGSAISGTVRGIPAGPDRTFTINGYDLSGSLTYTGSATATVTAGQQVTVSIAVRSTNSTTPTNVVLEILSPIAVNYEFSFSDGYLEISGEISNPSSLTANDVSVVLSARNASGALMDQGTKVIGDVPPGTLFFTFRFPREVFASGDKKASSIDYVISHSLGGFDTGSAMLTG
jgi:hypothetical protein